MKTKLLLQTLLIGGLFFNINNNISSVYKAASIDTFEIENVLNWINVSNSYFDKDGAHGIRNSTDNLFDNGIGLKQQLNVEENKVATITFQIPDYDHESRELRENHVSNKKIEDGVSVDRPYDIYLHNVNTNYHAIFRIWSNNSSVKGENSSYIEFCESETSSWETYPGGDISGVFTNGSSFTFSFDTTNFLSIKCDWKDQGEQMVPFHKLGNIGDKETQYLNFMRSKFSKAQDIEFWFAHQKLEPNTVNEVVIKEVNEQPLSVVDNKFDDTKAPIVAPIHESSNDVKYELGAEYTMRLEKYYNDPSTKANFYVRPSSDVTCSIDTLVENSTLLGKLSTETEWKKLGEIDSSSSLIKRISFDKPGTWDLKLEVKDNANNVGYSPIYNIEVVKGYSISLLGTIPETGVTNQEITLPKAIATDANDVEREVKVTVEDSLGNTIEVNDYKFIPTSVGIHYVIYSSSYTENNVTYSANKVEREIIITKGEEKPNEDNKDNNSTTTIIIVVSSIVVVAIGAFLIVKFASKKRLGNK